MFNLKSNVFINALFSSDICKTTSLFCDSTGFPLHAGAVHRGSCPERSIMYWSAAHYALLCFSKVRICLHINIFIANTYANSSISILFIKIYYHIMML